MVDPVYLGVIPSQVGESRRTFEGRIDPDDAFILNSSYRACQNHVSDTAVVSPIWCSRLAQPGRDDRGEGQVELDG